MAVEALRVWQEAEKYKEWSSAVAAAVVVVDSFKYKSELLCKL